MRSLWGHMTENTTKKTISRRAVAGGMAWSVPAIAFASAAPAATVSPLFTAQAGNVCKYPGGSVSGVKHAYMFPLTVTNIANEKVCVKIVGGQVTFDSGGTAGTPKWYTRPPHLGGVLAPNEVCIPAGGSVTYYYVVDKTGNSANESGTVRGVFQGTGSETGRQSTEYVDVAFSSTPPDCKSGDAVVEPSPTEAAAASPTTAAEPSPTSPAEPTVTAEPSPTAPAEPTTTPQPTPTAPAESSAPAVSESAAAPTQP